MLANLPHNQMLEKKLSNKISHNLRLFSFIHRSQMKSRKRITREGFGWFTNPKGKMIFTYHHILFRRIEIMDIEKYTQKFDPKLYFFSVFLHC